MLLDQDQCVDLCLENQFVPFVHLLVRNQNINIFLYSLGVTDLGITMTPCCMFQRMTTCAADLLTSLPI